MQQHALGLPKIQDAGRKRGGCVSQEWFSLDGDIAFGQSVFKCETHQCDSGGQQQVSTIVDAAKLFYSMKRGEVDSTSAQGGGYRIASGCDGDITFSWSVFKCETHQCDSGGKQQVSTIVDAAKLL